MAKSYAPYAIARAAERLGCKSTAFTYNDPAAHICNRYWTHWSTYGGTPMYGVELTTLLIPGHNDRDEKPGRDDRVETQEAGSGHVAGKPDRARKIAMAAGLCYVYTSNVHNRQGDTTPCPFCDLPVIVRDLYDIEQHRLDAGRPLPGLRHADRHERNSI